MKAGTAYAAGTTVAPEKSQMEIKQALNRYGAEGFALAEMGRRCRVEFRARGRDARPHDEARRLGPPPGAKGRGVKESVNHPAHYNAHPSGVECIAVVEHFTFNVGNAVKYLWRAGLKGALIEDLKKARWYVDREIQRLEAECAAAPGAPSARGVRAAARADATGTRTRSTREDR